MTDGTDGLVLVFGGHCGPYDRLLPPGFGLHSPAIEAARLPYLAAVRTIEASAPLLPYCSARTAAVLDRPPSAGHRWHAVRRPVRLIESAAVVAARGGRLFVDLGPGAAAADLLRRAGFPAVPCERILRTRARVVPVRRPDAPRTGSCGADRRRRWTMTERRVELLPLQG